MSPTVPSGPVVISPSSRALIRWTVLKFVEEAEACASAVVSDPTTWPITARGLGYAVYHLVERKEPEVQAFWRRNGEAVSAAVEALKANPAALSAAEASWAAQVRAMSDGAWTQERVRLLYELEAIRAWWATETTEGETVFGVLEDALITLDVNVQFGIVARPPWDLPRLFEVEAALNPYAGMCEPWWDWFGQP